MRFAVLGLLVLGPFLGLPSLQDDGEHKGTFEEVLAHRSGADLRAWRERHPWSLGDRLGVFLGEFLAARRSGDRTVIERREIEASFFAETIAEDPYSKWVVDVLAWDTEAWARQETAADTIRALPAIIAAGEGESAWAQIEEVRSAVAPPGGYALTYPDLARCAGAYLHAGDAARAKNLATELESKAEEMRQGAVMSACERVLSEVARIERNVDDAARRAKRAFEIADELDSGAATSLLDSIEALPSCGIDALLELAPGGPVESLAVLVSAKDRLVRRIPLAPSALVDRIRRALEPGSDPVALRELRSSILGPGASLFGRDLGIVADGVLSQAPLEGLAEDGGCVVRLSRAPLGSLAEPRGAPEEKRAAKRTWLVLLDERSPSPVLGSDEVRTLRGGTADDVRKAAAGCTHLYIDAGTVPADLRSKDSPGKAAPVEVAVIARSAPPGLAEALHASGVRDVLVGARAPGDEDRRFLADVCSNLSKGTPIVESLRAARATAGPSSRAFAGWILRRRA